MFSIHPLSINSINRIRGRIHRHFTGPAPQHDSPQLRIAPAMEQCRDPNVLEVVSENVLQQAFLFFLLNSLVSLNSVKGFSKKKKNLNPFFLNCLQISCYLLALNSTSRTEDKEEQISCFELENDSLWSW